MPEKPTRKQLAAMIDHTCLKAYASQEMIEQLCKEADELGCAMVAINSAQTKLCAELLKDSKVHVGAAISFPLGQTPLEVKLFETKTAIEDGADEIDYVVNLSNVKNKKWDDVEEEMKQITKLCHDHDVIGKVIFENCYLDADEIRKLSEIALKVRPDFIKTSTGFGTGGAKAEDVALMKSVVQDAVQVKAAGGIRSYEDALAMIEAGATRLGTSAAIAILGGCDETAD